MPESRLAFGIDKSEFSSGNLNLMVQAITKRAAKAGATAVVDVEHRNPTARPELRCEVEDARG
jgi:hypothetical protein